ncbi:MAG TPA: ATP-dependent DNA helicase RecG [Clostridiales bacterium]|nr:ATP-dependent DNA helicase RecG [Clostridiales bacterium]
MNNNSEDILKRPISCLKGIGAAREKLLNKIGVFTVKDLIQYYPRDYEDRSRLVKINNLQNEENSAFIGTITSKLRETSHGARMTIQKIEISDDTGIAYAVWFNQPYLKNVFRPGESYFFYGKIKRAGSFIEVQTPVYEKSGDHEKTKDSFCNIVPVYSTTVKLSQAVIRSAAKEGLKQVDGIIPEILPQNIREKYLLSEINYAIQNIHFPHDNEALNNSRYRLVFEELFSLQLSLLAVKKSFNEGKKGISFKKGENVHDLVKSLPFQLTNAQLKVFKDIETNMESSGVMNRLIQGDVGSGKTIVAVLALLKAVENGYQGVLMAPTGILAEQHYRLVKGLLQKYNVNTGLLTGNITGKEKSKVLEGIKNGDIDIVIGTHALIQDGVECYNLGLVITDEQHRFGVRQRACLSKKGENPDILVMTATPIPRTLALILYGDLDISVIDELPPGRTPVKTYIVNKSMRERINNFIRKNAEQGRQVYIICPLVEDSDDIDAMSTITLAEDIAKKDFKDLKVGLLHGKLKPDLKEQVMKDFIEGKIDILVSTTVVEVGVDVPNATIMVVENAERFGLAQLHQLRGRVGRGKDQSYCILYNESNSPIAKERMQVMEKTCDGFIISEKDLELRGPGEFFGTKQHGIPELKIANLYKDIELLKIAQQAASDMLKATSDILIEREPGWLHVNTHSTL